MMTVDGKIGQDKGYRMALESDEEAEKIVFRKLMANPEFLDMFHKESLLAFENHARTIPGIKLP